MDEKVLLFMLLCNGPLAWIIVLDYRSSGRSEARAEKAFALDRCQAKSSWLPGHRCNQHVVARLDLFEGYEYRFFKCLCEEHATEAQRRMTGPSYRLARVTTQDA